MVYMYATCCREEGKGKGKVVQKWQWEVAVLQMWSPDTCTQGDGTVFNYVFHSNTYL